MINLNKLAVEISKKEGGEQNLSIGQIKEVLRITLDILAKHEPSAVLAMLEKR